MNDKPIQSQKSTAPDQEAAPQIDPEVAAKPTRRRFTAEYKLRILDEVDAAPPGEQGAILRREGLYSSHISDWRAARRKGALRALGRKRGRKPNPNRGAEQRIADLERELARSQEELRKARLIVEVQGKVAGLLGLNFGSENNS
jgi:transposase